MHQSNSTINRLYATKQSIRTTTTSCLSAHTFIGVISTLVDAREAHSERASASYHNLPIDMTLDAVL